MPASRTLAAALVLFCAGLCAASDTRDSSEYEIKKERLAIIGGAVAASYASIYFVFLKEGWWAESEGFHFEGRSHDFRYASNLDKFGHFYAGALIGELFAMSYDWAGFSPIASALCAGATVAATQVLVEFKDGFSPYGYSIYDAMAGSLGGFYAMGRRLIPAMQYVDYKFAYFPNSKVYWNIMNAHGGEDRGGSLTGGNGIFVDDYYGGNQTHWLSFKAAKMLPDGARGYYPEWLALAFGWGINDWHFAREWGASRYEFYISPDVDFEAIIRPKAEWSRNAAKILSFIKFPAPALRIGRDSKLFLLHPWHGFAVRF